MKNFSAKNFQGNRKNISIFLLLLCFMFFSPMANALTHKDKINIVDKTIKDSTNNFNNKNAWYPSFHLAAQGVFMENPTAIALFNGGYHLFYKQNIKTSKGNDSVWGHVSGPDLLHWKVQKTALVSSEPYDEQGILSGSAIVDDGLLYLLYTGYSEKKLEQKIERHETQNLAMSKDGINFGKSANNPVIKMAPHYSYLEFSSEKFKDPYVWKLEDRYYAIVGTQYTKTKDGALLLFKSKDLRNWVCINVTALGQNGEMGDFWEKPSIVHINGNDVLSFSTSGIKPHGKMFLNKIQSGAFVGKLDYNSGKFAQKGAFMLYDYGFDFYAPHFVKTLDGRNIFIAFLGMDITPAPEEAENWTGMMTLPRELKIINGKILTVPIKEIDSLRIPEVCLKDQTVVGEKDFAGVRGDVYELDIAADMTNSKIFTIKLRSSAAQETLLSYNKDSKILKLNRDKSGSVLKGEREVSLPLENNKLKLRIFVDKSSIEIFANDGVAAMSSRIYPDKSSVHIKFISDGETKLEKLNFYKLKSVND